MVATGGSGWRLAPCLIALIRECDRLYPSRSIASDGSIGDQAHAGRGSASDHNPSNGWVCAVDVTDDKAHGCDADLLARHLVASRDPRIKYVIWNGTIVKSYQSNGVPAWQPQPYTGINAHDRHTHVSVHNVPEARDDVRPWWPTREDSDMTPEQAAKLDRIDRVLGNLDPSVASIRSVTDALYTATVQGRLGGLAALIRQIVREELANQSGSQ